MGKHTPGPWNRCKHGGASDGSSIHVTNGVGWFMEISAGYNFVEMADPEEARAQFAVDCAVALAAPAMLEALKAIMQLIEDGYLVRNTMNDADPDWAMSQIEPVRRFQAAAAALAAAEPETEEGQ